MKMQTMTQMSKPEPTCRSDSRHSRRDYTNATNDKIVGDAVLSVVQLISMLEMGRGKRLRGFAYDGSADFGQSVRPVAVVC